jgi:hypothetical protein
VESYGLWVGENLLAWVGLGTERCALLELSTGVLRQVRHHGLLVDVWICHLIGLDELTNSKPVVSQAHGFSGVLKGVLGVPVGPVRAQARSDVVDQSANGFSVVPV